MRLKSTLKDSFSGRAAELISNTFIFAVGTIGSKIILFLLIPLYSSVLAADEFGNADLVISSMSLLYPLFSLGIEEAIIRYGLTQFNNRKSALRISVDITLVGGILFSLILLLVSSFYSIDHVALIIVIYFLSSLSSILASYAKVKEKNSIYTANALIKALTLCISNILFLVVYL